MTCADNASKRLWIATEWVPMSDNQTKRVALYLRCSTDQQTTDSQAVALRDYCASRGWQIVQEYADQGVSGAKDKRPQLSLLMADARRRRFSAVLVFRWDRFARSTVHLAQALQEFQALGLDFISVTEGTDTTTPQGRFLFGIMACVAELERNIIRERVKAGLAASKRKLETGPYRRSDGHLVQRIGRPVLAIDLDRARALRDQNPGWTWVQVAKAMKVKVETLRLKLKQETHAQD